MSEDDIFLNLIRMGPTYRSIKKHVTILRFVVHCHLVLGYKLNPSSTNLLNGTPFWKRNTPFWRRSTFLEKKNIFEQRHPLEKKHTFGKEIPFWRRNTLSEKKYTLLERKNHIGKKTNFWSFTNRFVRFLRYRYHSEVLISRCPMSVE